jgi:hypothetical protein
MEREDHARVVSNGKAFIEYVDTVTVRMSNGCEPLVERLPSLRKSSFGKSLFSIQGQQSY